MTKNNYEIICKSDDYEKIISILSYLRIQYSDETAIFTPPASLNNDAERRKFGVIGISLAIIAVYLSVMFLFWTQRVSYPINVGGKELFDFIYSVPVIFEVVVLFVVVGSFLAFIFSNGIFRFKDTHTDKQTIYIENIFHINLIKDKLKEFDIELNKIA